MQGDFGLSQIVEDLTEHAGIPKPRRVHPGAGHSDTEP